MPARAAYAAAEADVFPVEAHISAGAPRSIALDTATVIPRSLNDPVGLTPSFLMKTWQLCPTRALSLGAKISGVFPSPREIMALHGGRNSRNRSITPLPRFIFTCSIDNLLFEINSGDCRAATAVVRSISYAVFCLKKKTAPSHDYAREPARRFARAESKSTGQRSLSRFRHGA